MNRLLAILVTAAMPLTGALAAEDIPAWAYPVNPPGAAAAQKDDGTLIRVPDSSIAMTRTQMAGRESVPDWHPEDHPEMPAIVKNGREGVRACGYCHQPTGVGRPENASLVGLDEEYIKRQVDNFRKGDRQGAEPRRIPQNLMIGLSKNVTPEEVAIAAKYFASLKPKSFVKVVEADIAPKTIVTGGMLAMAPEGGMEPIGSRIIEVPEDLERAENRDSRTPFTAYVPKGSLAKGEGMVAGRGCAMCHGAGLTGIGDTPRLAGRSPSYLVRQLYDFKNGKRSGASAAPMRPIAADLSLDDMIAIASFLASKGE